MKKRSWIGIIALGLPMVVAFGYIKLSYKAFSSASGNMLPGLYPGDAFFADKSAYSNQGPSRGDLVVYEFPRAENVIYSGRVIGLPNDRIEIVDKKVFVNGQALRQEKSERQSVELLEKYGDGEFEFFYESAGDQKYEIVLDHDSLRRSWGPQKLGENEYFIMGDNRDHSFDSRFWGTITKEAIIGQAKFVYFSKPPKEYSIRWNRIGKRL